MPVRSAETDMFDKTYDFIVVGSGFGGSVSAMRLVEKGYSVVVLERGVRFRDEDYPKTNWNIWKYLWLPSLRCFGIQELSLFRGLFVFGSCGVGGGSLVYSAVLMEPGDDFYKSSTWNHLADWKTVLRPFYDTARKLLGVNENPHLWPADEALGEVAEELGWGESFRSTEVGYFFGEPGEEVPDPYFEGEGPPRSGCIHCGGCMVGCRYNAKNSLDKNYLYFAEKWGAEVRAKADVRNIRPLSGDQPDGARYEVHYRSSTAFLHKPIQMIRGRNIVVSAGVMGTIELLLRCRDDFRSLPNLSMEVGKTVRTNNDVFLGGFTLQDKEDHSKGLAITSIFRADQKTHVQPLRFSDGSSMLFWTLSSPLIDSGGNFIQRLVRTLVAYIRQPIETILIRLRPGLTRRGIALLLMQDEDNQMSLRLGRSLGKFFRRGLVIEHDVEKTIPTNIELGNRIARSFAEKIGGFPLGSVTSTLLNLPTTAHMLGGCIMGSDATDGVVDQNCEVFNYPGLFVIDGSIVPANPGINPSLTITALAEYAVSRMPAKEGGLTRPPLFMAQSD